MHVPFQKKLAANLCKWVLQVCICTCMHALLYTESLKWVLEMTEGQPCGLHLHSEFPTMLFHGQKLQSQISISKLLQSFANLVTNLHSYPGSFYQQCLDKIVVQHLFLCMHIQQKKSGAFERFDNVTPVLLRKMLSLLLQGEKKKTPADINKLRIRTNTKLLASKVFRTQIFQQFSNLLVKQSSEQKDPAPLQNHSDNDKEQNVLKLRFSETER